MVRTIIIKSICMYLGQTMDPPILKEVLESVIPTTTLFSDKVPDGNLEICHPDNGLQRTTQGPTCPDEGLSSTLPSLRSVFRRSIRYQFGHGRQDGDSSVYQYRGFIKVSVLTRTWYELPRSQPSTWWSPRYWTWLQGPRKPKRTQRTVYQDHNLDSGLLQHRLRFLHVSTKIQISVLVPVIRTVYPRMHRKVLPWWVRTRGRPKVLEDGPTVSRVFPLKQVPIYNNDNTLYSLRGG